MASKDELTRLILAIIGETAAAKGLHIANLGLDSPVDRTLGLDSLDWAAVVVRLEIETDIDPFAAGTPYQLATVADLVDFYVAAA